LQENAFLVYARDYLGDNLLDSTFLVDVVDGLPASKAEVAVPGGHIMKSDLWLCVGEDSPDCCFNLLHLLLATESPSVDKLKVCHLGGDHQRIIRIIIRIIGIIIR
jgi:hypothetical protein